MGAASLIPRVVFDTNTVVSALLFSKGRLSWLRQLWCSGKAIPLVSKETTEELLRVLRYPKFRLSRAEREALLADYLPYVRTVIGEQVTCEIPGCRDVHDEKFLKLAVTGKADYLVTGDADILSLRDRFPIPIVTPAGFQRKLLEDAS